ncbi:MAG TPA: hypothetical protein VNU19_05865 [Candidatus Acidoferrum sp.]|nr:hypothetical protein [Candidatus Acidoferrum sp.]
MRKVDIAHAGQTVPEALDQLVKEIKAARRDGEQTLLVVHGFGASGAGGAIKASLVTELPRLARMYGFKSYSDKDNIPPPGDLNLPRPNPGSTALVFGRLGLDRESKSDFRPNFRNFRSRVKVRVVRPAPPKPLDRCPHTKRQLISRGALGSNYKCRRCGKSFLVPPGSNGSQG